jgi:hypothetical protein
MSIEYLSNINGQILSPAACDCVRNVNFVTLMGWYYPYDFSNLDLNDTPNKGFIFDAYENSTFSTFRFGIARVDNTHANLYGASRPNSGSGYNQIISTTQIGLNDWFHIAAVFDFVAFKVSLYLNGALDYLSAAQGGWSAPTFNGNMTNEAVGQNANVGSAGNWLHGKLDDVRVYNRAISANEMKTIFACNGSDRIMNGCQHRFLMTAGGYNSGASGVGVLKDWGAQKKANDNKFPAQAIPLWKESKIKLQITH